MNIDIIKGNWKEVKGLLQKQWGRLTDDEVARMNGTYEELEGYLQKKYGYRKDRIKKEIEQFIRENRWLI